MAVEVAGELEDVNAQEDDSWAMRPITMNNSLGSFDGHRFYLRNFAVWYRWAPVYGQFNRDRPEEGEVDGVHFQQTMGKITFWYPLSGADAALTESDFKVEMSCWEIAVSGGSGKKKIGSLSGDLFKDIRRKLSWWCLWENDPEWPGKWLVVCLAKLQHRAWKSIWSNDCMNVHRKTAFGWTESQISRKLAELLKSDTEKLKEIEPGEVQEAEKDMCVGLPAERLCTGIDDDEETADLIHILVHLDEESVEMASGMVPMEELFSADVEHNYLEVALRYDGFMVCWGELNGEVVPELTRWEISQVRRKLPKDTTIKAPAYYNPVLRITLVKAPGYQAPWGHAFKDMQMPAFEPPRERISWTDRMQRALVLAPTAPTRNDVKVEKARSLCTSVESDEDLILHQAVVKMHLDSNLEDLATKFRQDLGTFFSMRVGERLLSVSVMADTEYTMCVGGLGGECVPSKTAWEITREPNANGEGEHLALKITIAKQGKGRWGDVFTRYEPWQVTQDMWGVIAAALPDGQAEPTE